MIAFLSLFLGLVTGPQVVSVAVEGPVAAVEIVLDGRRVTRIAGAPWVSEVDFGSDLAPHELVARALDTRGEEIARARQWLNLPRPPAEAEIVLERNAEGRAVAARLSWSCVAVKRPIASTVTFDGKPLPLDNLNRIPIPLYDPETTHVLSADLKFTSVVTARTDMVLGALAFGEVRTELTAVPVRMEKGEKLPLPEGLAGWFVKGEEALSVRAVEEGGARVLLVRDLGTGEATEKLGSGSVGTTFLRRFRDISVKVPDALRFDMTLRKKDRLRIVWPVSQLSVGAGLRANLFDVSRELRPEEGGMHWLLTGFLHPIGDHGLKRFADAVAVAGLEATGAYTRRAVVLVLGGGAKDGSKYEPAAVRQYLARINVPLYVWSLAGDSPASSAWKEAEDISSLDKLRKAFARFRKELNAQRIVWIEGRHLPQEIALSEKAKGIEIVR